MLFWNVVYAYEKERFGCCDFVSSAVFHRVCRYPAAGTGTSTSRNAGPATRASSGSRGGSTAARPTHRGDRGRAWAGLLLGAGLLGLEWKMGVGRWGLASAPVSTCRVGRTSLGPSWPRLRLGPRLLALNPEAAAGFVPRLGHSNMEIRFGSSYPAHPFR